eukprot:4128156-Prymnesium_polylepis.2
MVMLGSFTNWAAASLAYARFIGRDKALKAQAAHEASLAADAPLTAEQAIAQAKREGLTLVRAAVKSGYTGVFIEKKGFGSRFTTPGGKGKQRWGMQQYLGSFATAEEAALVQRRAAQG